MKRIHVKVLIVCLALCLITGGVRIWNKTKAQERQMNTEVCTTSRTTSSLNSSTTSSTISALQSKLNSKEEINQEKVAKEPDFEHDFEQKPGIAVRKKNLFTVREPLDEEEEDNQKNAKAQDYSSTEPKLQPIKEPKPEPEPEPEPILDEEQDYIIEPGPPEPVAPVERDNPQYVRHTDMEQGIYNELKHTYTNGHKELHEYPDGTYDSLNVDQWLTTSAYNNFISYCENWHSGSLSEIELEQAIRNERWDNIIGMGQYETRRIGRVKAHVFIGNGYMNSKFDLFMLPWPDEMDYISPGFLYIRAYYSEVTDQSKIYFVIAD